MSTNEFIIVFPNVRDPESSIKSIYYYLIHVFKTHARHGAFSSSSSVRLPVNDVTTQFSGPTDDNDSRSSSPAARAARDSCNGYNFPLLKSSVQLAGCDDL